MSEQFHRRMTSLLQKTHKKRGKITIFTAVAVCLVLGSFYLIFDTRVPSASADDVTTSVTVLNTPPVWTVNAQESTESSTTTPTNAGAVITWTAVGTDSSNDLYYLIICKTSGAATANAGAAPSCNGGVSNQWAVSTSTTSGLQASAATTTIATFPFQNESNDWYAFICDGNATLPRCNLAYTQGSGNTASPFVINHPPVFAAISNNGPVNPGAVITWSSTSYDNDSLGGSNDQVRLFVCKSNDFNGTYCGAGGSWATSTLATTDAATSTTIVIPTQDKLYNAYVYLIDEHNLVATSTIHGSNSFFAVNNVAPSVTASSISLLDRDNVGNLTLNTPAATSGPFKVTFTAVDNNSCLTASSTNEISSAITNVFRSGVGSTSCQVAGDFNSNNCYPAASPLVYDLVCTQDGASCSGATDSDATFTCTYSLWFNADPTDASTPWTAQNWLATVRATDNNGATSTLTEATTGNDLVSFLAFDVSTTTIVYGSLEPGQSTDPLFATTDLKAQGNTGLDEDLYGDTMCTNWTAPDSCDSGGINASSEIAVGNQKVATSGVAYASATALTSSSSPTSVTINVQKTTATSSIQTKNTFWGISIPIAITLAGNYTGQNTIVGKVSNFLNW